MKAPFLSRAHRSTTRDLRTVNLTTVADAVTRVPYRFLVVIAVMIVSVATSVVHAQVDVVDGEEVHSLGGSKVISADGLCLYASASRWTGNTTVKLAGCDDVGRTTWRLTDDGELKIGEKCLTPQDSRVTLSGCPEGDAPGTWDVDGDVLIHGRSGMCARAQMGADASQPVDSRVERTTEARRVSSSYEPSEGAMRISPCDGSDVSQRWQLPVSRKDLGKEIVSASIEHPGSSKSSLAPSSNVPAKQAAPAPPAPAGAPTAAPVRSTASGEAMPVGDIPGWKQVFADDFTKDASIVRGQQVTATGWCTQVTGAVSG